MTANNYYVTTFYKFVAVQDPETVASKLEELAAKFAVKGLVILAHEGLNTTLCAQDKNALQSFISATGSLLGLSEENFFFKNSVTYDREPFTRFIVKIRDEIVTLGIPGEVPPADKNRHLSPEEWNRVLKEEKDFVLIDTRNWYEVQLGTFKGALDPKTEQFTEFPKYLEEQNIPKDKKVLIFCTGGIRCEKGILEMQKKGFENVYQLEGGILNYIEQFPNDQFEGECFVFDHRIAVDQNLQPTKNYKWCPHCGQPANIEALCKMCDSDFTICEGCLQLAHVKETCSKNCAHHFKLNPDKKIKKQPLFFDYNKKTT